MLINNHVYLQQELHVAVDAMHGTDNLSDSEIFRIEPNMLDFMTTSD